MFDAPKEKFRLLPNIQKCKHVRKMQSIPRYYDLFATKRNTRKRKRKAKINIYS